jgi:predicted ABC-class ATPase
MDKVFNAQLGNVSITARLAGQKCAQFHGAVPFTCPTDRDMRGHV